MPYLCIYWEILTNSIHKAMHAKRIILTLKPCVTYSKISI